MLRFTVLRKAEYRNCSRRVTYAFIATAEGARLKNLEMNETEPIRGQLCRVQIGL